MTTTLLSPLPVQRFYDNNNNPLVGGQLFSYVAGTSTPQATYTDSTGATPNTNPVILNSRGEANVWLTPGQSYKLVLQDALDNVIWTVDQLSFPIATNYLAPATGAVTRTVNSKLSDSLSVTDFGAVGDGVTDDTAALQAAITAAISLKVKLLFMGLTYKHSGLTVNGALTIEGEGTDVTTLLCSSTTGNGITVNTQLAFRCSGITFACSGTPTAGAGILLTSSTAANQHSVIRDCTFNSLFNSIQTTSAYLWLVEHCTFNNYINTGVWVENDYNPDSGDSVVVKCTFAGTTGSQSIGVFQVSSGGLRVENNKFVQGAYGYQMQLAHGAQTGDLFFVGNSIENQSVSGIQMNRIVGGAADMHFSDVVISGNQFLGTATGIPINLNDTNTAWLAGVTITGNQIDVLNGGTPAYAILINGAAGFTITGNTILGNTGGTAGIGIASGAASGTISGNTLTGFTTPISNASASTYSAKKVYQTTTSGITCSTTYGPVFAGNALVTFPTGLFLQAPVVTATAISGTSAISAVVSSASGTNCTITACAFTTGSVVQVYVRAEADY